MNSYKKFTLQCLLISSLCIQHFDLQADFQESAQNNHLTIQVLTMIQSTTLTACYGLALCIMWKMHQDTLENFFKSKDEVREEESMNHEVPQVTFADIAGLDEAKESAQDIIEYLKNPGKFTAMGAKIPKGILMYGEPGTGKTLFARSIAGEINSSSEITCSFIAIKGTDFASKWIGESQDRVKELFEKAKKQAPCIIFVDEIDAVAQKRTGHDDSGSLENNRTVMALLNEMDGFSQNTNPIIIIGATNRIESLDPAILRPGRFDRKIHINKPYIKDRAALLQIAFKKTCISQDVNIDNLAQVTQGFSGAEITNLVNEAIILAIKDNSTTVCMKHIEMAYDNITLGCENKGMHQTKDNLWNTAIHEAGHLIGFLFKDKTVAVRKVSIIPRGNTLGVAHMLPLTESYSLTKNDMKSKIISLLAGRFAEEAFGFDLSTGAASDLEYARTIAYDMVINYGMGNNLRDASYSQFKNQLPNDVATKIYNEIDNIIEDCRQATRQLIADHMDDIQKIAELLMEKGTVLGSEIYQLLNLVEPQGINFNL